MLGLWLYIEADFQREYSIDLSNLAWLRTVSWRRFSTLVQGLSPRSAVAAHYDSIAKQEALQQKDGRDAGAEDFWRRVAMTGRPSGG